MKKATIKSELNVMLLNRVTSTELRQHKYAIYLHKCANDIYVGESDDMVLRWKEHNEAAFNTEHRDYNQKVKDTNTQLSERLYIIKKRTKQMTAYRGRLMITAKIVEEKGHIKNGCT